LSGYRPAIILAIVLLPQPDLPMIAINFPPGIVKEKSSSSSTDQDNES